MLPLQGGTIFILTEAAIEVYNRLGVQIATHDSENFTELAAWGDYLLAGTSEGDLVAIEPNQWLPVNSFPSNLADKNKVAVLQVTSANLVYIEVAGGFNQVV